MRKHLGWREVFQVDAAERGLEQQRRADDLIRVLGVQHDGHGIHAAQPLEQQRLALHHRQAGLRADVAQPQDARAVGDHGDGIPLVGVLVDQLGVFLDGPAGRCHAGRVPDGEIIQRADACLRDGLDLAAIEGVQLHRVGRRLLRLGQQFLDIGGFVDPLHVRLLARDDE